jgi:hypothetical protein
MLVKTKWPARMPVTVTLGDGSEEDGVTVAPPFREGATWFVEVRGGGREINDIIPLKRIRLQGEARHEKEKPTHYTTICLSVYTEDLKRLDALVNKAKKLDNRASRSSVLRDGLDLLEKQ